MKADSGRFFFMIVGDSVFLVVFLFLGLLPIRMGLADPPTIYARRLQQAQNFSDPLAMAIIKGDVKAVQRLLEQGSNPHLLFDTGGAHNYTLLMLNAGRTPVTEDVRLQLGRVLLEYGIDVNAEASSGETALIIATKYGHSPLSQALLDAGANPKAKDLFTGYTPLMWASGPEGTNVKSDGSIELVRQLLQKGASASTQSHRGSTALHFAAHKGHADVAKLLIDNGADVNGKTDAGVAPLSITATNGDLPLTKLLVSKGARLNDQDTQGQSALMVAAWYFHQDVVSYLLNEGADADLKSNDGRTALTGTLLRSNMLDESWPAQQRIIQMLEKHSPP